MTPPILVTGATGTIGSHLVQRLAAKNVPTRAFVRDLANAQPLRDATVELVKGDLNDPASIDAALEGVKKLFLLSPAAANQVELQGNAVEAARRAKVEHIVKVSALGTDPDSVIDLARWHAQMEAQIRERGIGYTFLRPHTFMQNFFGFAPTIHQEGAFYAPLGDAAVSMVDARDVADVAAAVLTSEGHVGETYVITGPDAITYAEAARILSDVLGTEIRYIDVAPETYRQSLIEAGLSGWLAADLTALYDVFRGGMGSEVSPVVERVTGQPGRSFAQFARDHADAFRRPTSTAV